MTNHCRKTGVILRELEAVTELNLHGENKTVTTSRTQYSAPAIILATGAHYRELGAKGEKEFRGKGVSYCGVCDGPLFKGKDVMVVGGGNSAAITTLYLAGLAANVTLIHRREVLRCEEAYFKDIEAKPNVKILWSNEVQEIKGEKVVDRVITLDTKTGKTQEITSALFLSKLEKLPIVKLPKNLG